jgi:uncharacterized protein (TIGR02001 family)
MRIMKKLLSAAALTAAATAALTGAAAAEGSFSGNVALTTDYVFRGISQTQGDPALQGGFDYSHGSFYAGTWGSSIDFGSAGGLATDTHLELDLYAGFKPTLGPVTLDLGVIGYFYPDAGIDDLDYVELKVGGSVAPAEGLTIGATLFYSPEFTFNGGDSLYAEATAGYTLNEVFSVSGGVGNQSVDAAGYFVTPTSSTDNYTTWNVGGTLSKWGFGLDVRYYDADEDITNFAGEVVSDERVVATLKRAL